MLPRLQETSKSRDMIQEFLGLNHNIRASDNEFYDMKNITSDYYPTLSPRKPRGIAMELNNCGGLLAKDKLCYIENDTLHYGDFTVPLIANLGKERQMVSMGAYVIVYPDNIYLNTADLTDFGRHYDREENFPTEDNSISIKLCDADGNDIPVPMYINGCGWNATGHVDDNLIPEMLPTKYSHIGYVNTAWDTNFSIAEPHNVFTQKIVDYIDSKRLNGAANYFLDAESQEWYEILREGDFPAGTRQVRAQATGPVEVKVETINGYHPSVQVKPIGASLTYAEVSVSYDVYTQREGYIEVHGETKRRTIEVKGSEAPTEGEYMLDMTASPPVLRKCEKDGEWTKDIPLYVKIISPDIGQLDQFTEHYVKFLGSNDDYPLQSRVLDNLNSDYKIYGKTEKYASDAIVIKGSLATGVTFISDIKWPAVCVSETKLIPFDYIVESQNRLWGCSYGADETGKKVNKIYASALGDFRTWNKFDGTDDDSYFVNLGSDGEFTGAINYNGYPIFFKENCIHRVYGDYPSQYQVTIDNSFGLQKGSAKSLQVIAGRLFYKAIDGIYSYDGATNSLISLKLGLDRFSSAIGGNVNNKYYVSMISSSDNKRRLYVYDIMKDTWHVEDEIDVKFMERFDDNLYIATESGSVYTVKDKLGNSKEKVEWYAETGIIGYALPDAKYISQIQIRLNIANDAEMSMYIEYDSDEDWQYKGTVTGSKLRSYTLPIQPRRCDHFKIRFEGKGECKIFSITKIIENGGIV